MAASCKEQTTLLPYNNTAGKLKRPRFRVLPGRIGLVPFQDGQLCDGAIERSSSPPSWSIVRLVVGVGMWAALERTHEDFLEGF